MSSHKSFILFNFINSFGFPQFPKENLSISKPMIQGRFPEPRTKGEHRQRSGSSQHHNGEVGGKGSSKLTMNTDENPWNICSGRLFNFNHYYTFLSFLKKKKKQLDVKSQITYALLISHIPLVFSMSSSFSLSTHTVARPNVDSRQEKQKAGKSEVRSRSCSVSKQGCPKITAKPPHLLISSSEKGEDLLVSFTKLSWKSNKVSDMKHSQNFKML